MPSSSNSNGLIILSRTLIVVEASGRPLRAPRAEEAGTLTVEEKTVGSSQGELTGTVVPHSLRLSPDPVAFDPVYLSCEDSRELRLYNDSSCDVTLTDLTLDSEVFTLDTDRLPATIPTESSVPFDVHFQPTERISYAAVVDATVAGQSVQVDITGEGTPTATGYMEVVIDGKDLVHSKANGDGHVDSQEKMQKIIDAVGKYVAAL